MSIATDGITPDTVLHINVDRGGDDTSDGLDRLEKVDRALLLSASRATMTLAPESARLIRGL